MNCIPPRGLPPITALPILYAFWRLNKTGWLKTSVCNKWYPPNTRSVYSGDCEVRSYIAFHNQIPNNKTARKKSEEYIYYTSQRNRYFHPGVKSVNKNSVSAILNKRNSPDINLQTPPSQAWPAFSLKTFYRKFMFLRGDNIEANICV